MTRPFRLHNALLLPVALATLTPVAQAAAFQWTGGSYSATGLPATLSAADSLLVSGTTGSPILDRNLANAGTVDLAAAAFYGNGITLANAGSFRLAVDGNLYATGANWSFVNTGTLSKTAGSGTSTFNSGITFTNNGGTVDAGSGTIVFANGATSFNAGTRFTGAGTTLVGSNAAFNDGFSVAAGSTLALQGGTFTGGSNTAAAAGAVLSGVAGFNGGTMNGVWTVASGSTLNTRSTDAGGNVVVGGTLNNLGTVAVAGAFYGNGLTLVNGGTFQLTTNDALNATGANWTFDNSGALQKTGGGTSVFQGGVAFVNRGVAIDIAAGSTLQWNNGSSTFDGGTLFRNGGTALVSSNAVFNDALNVAAGTTLALQGATFTGGNAVLGGVANFNGGMLNGAWTVASGATLNTRPTDAGGNVVVGGRLTNLGTVSVTGAFYGNGATVDNRGTFRLTTNDSLYATGSNWTFTNNGALQKTGTGTSVIASGVGFVNNGVAVDIAAGSTLQWANGDSLFNGGSGFQGGGTALVASNATFKDTLSVAAGTTLALQGATFTGGNAVLQGVADFNGGTMNGVWTVAAGSTLNTRPTDAGGGAVVGGTLNNLGTLAVAGAFYGNGLTLNNSGTIKLTTNDALNATGSNWTLVNSGALQKTGGGTSVIASGVSFINQGVAIDIAAGSTLQWANGSNAFNGGTRFTGGGTALVSNNAGFNDAVSVAAGTTLALTGATSTGGSTTGSTAGAVLTGSAEFNGGQLAGTWTVASGGTLNTQPTAQGGSAVIATTVFANEGRVNVNGDLYGNGTAFVNRTGGVVALTTDGNLYATGANWTLTNAGLLLKTGTQGTSTVTAGIAFTNQAGGTVQVDSGALAFQGSFANAGTLRFGIGGVGSNGAIDLASATVLGGSFAASLLAGFTPVIGQTFDVMNFAGGYSGSFANTVYTVDGVTFTGTYRATEFDLTVTAIAAVPEPATWATSIAGLLLMSVFMGRRRGGRES